MQINQLPAIPQAPANADVMAIEVNGVTYKVSKQALASAILAQIGASDNVVDVSHGGTGLTASPSMLTNLDSTAAANVLQASPRPGVTGTLGIGNGGTGATTAANARANLGITPANIGAAASSHTHSYLPLSGGTLTDNLSISRNSTDSANTTSDISFGKTNEGTESNDSYTYTGYPGTWTRIRGQNRYKRIKKSDNSTTWYPARFSFLCWSAAASSGERLSTAEYYYMPACTDGLTENKSYDILTTKNLVTVNQGGTGATTAPTARSNLGFTGDTVSAITYTNMNNNASRLMVYGDLCILQISGQAKANIATNGTILTIGSGYRPGGQVDALLYNASTDTLLGVVLDTNGALKLGGGTLNNSQRFGGQIIYIIGK